MIAPTWETKNPCSTASPTARGVGWVSDGAGWPWRDLWPKSSGGERLPTHFLPVASSRYRGTASETVASRPPTGLSTSLFDRHHGPHPSPDRVRREQPSGLWPHHRLPGW